MKKSIDATNVCLVTSYVDGDKLLMWNPPRAGQELSKEKALVLAAWLVVMAGEDGEGFSEYIAAVQRS